MNVRETILSRVPNITGNMRRDFEEKDCVLLLQTSQRFEIQENQYSEVEETSRSSELSDIDTVSGHTMSDDKSLEGEAEGQVHAIGITRSQQMEDSRIKLKVREAGYKIPTWTVQEDREEEEEVPIDQMASPLQRADQRGEPSMTIDQDGKPEMSIEQDGKPKRKDSSSSSSSSDHKKKSSSSSSSSDKKQKKSSSSSEKKKDSSDEEYSKIGEGIIGEEIDEDIPYKPLSDPELEDKEVTPPKIFKKVTIIEPKKEEVKRKV